jgi:chromosome segregation and condensation protein ScpB
MVKWELLEKSLTNSELLGYKIREEFKGLPSNLYEEEKNKPFLDDIADSFLRLLEKLEKRYQTQTIKIDEAKKRVELNGKVFNYSDFPEEEKKILENIGFVQGKVPVPIKTLKKYLKRIRKDNAYKELKEKVKEYNGMQIYLYYNHKNEKDPFVTTIELRKIIENNSIEYLKLTNNKYYFDNIDSIVKKALGLS